MFKSGQAVHFHQEGEIQRAVDPVDIILLNGKLLFDDGKKLFINARFHFQTDGLAPLSLLQLLFDLLQQILRLVLVDG